MSKREASWIKTSEFRCRAVGSEDQSVALDTYSSRFDLLSIKIADGKGRLRKEEMSRKATKKGKAVPSHECFEVVATDTPIIVQIVVSLRVVQPQISQVSHSRLNSVQTALTHCAGHSIRALLLLQLLLKLGELRHGNLLLLIHDLLDTLDLFNIVPATAALVVVS